MIRKSINCSYFSKVSLEWSKHSLSSTLSSVPQPPLFNIQLSSTPPQFHTSSVSHLLSCTLWRVSHTEEGVYLRRLWNWGIFSVELRGFRCGTEGCVDLRRLKCWSERFLGLKRSGPFLWNRCVELRGLWKWGGPHLISNQIKLIYTVVSYSLSNMILTNINYNIIFTISRLWRSAAGIKFLKIKFTFYNHTLSN